MSSDFLYYNQNKIEESILPSVLWRTLIQLVRFRGWRCPVQGSSEEESTAVPVYSTICLNIIHCNTVQSSLQILNATCYIQTIFSFNPKTSSVGCHRVMVPKQANKATLRTCPLCKDAGNADGVMKAVFRDFCTLHSICTYTSVYEVLCVSTSNWDTLGCNNVKLPLLRTILHDHHFQP